MIQLKCDKCFKIYNYDLNSSICPHKGFPHEKCCLKHGRFHCGNLECINEDKILNFKQKERKEV